MSTPLFSYSWGFASRRRLLAVLAVLAMGTFAATSVSAQDIGNTLTTNQSLKLNQQLKSSNKNYVTWVQPDGNLEVYALNTTPWTRLWYSGASSAGSSYVLQGDGNLCARSAAGQNGWCNYSNGAAGDYYMMMRDNGHLEIYRGKPTTSASSVLVWTTGLDPVYYGNKYADLKNAFGTDAKRLMDHWITYGRFEGRSPKNGVTDEGFVHARSVNLETMFYANKYPDLKNAFAYDAEKLYQHWMTYGRGEGRLPNKATEDYLAPAARSANGQSSMRNSDWLHVNEFLRAPNGGFIAILQGDLNFVIYQTGSMAGISAATHRWNYGATSSGPGVLRMQTDGHFCVYKGSVTAQGQGVKCMPAGAGGPTGRYFLTLQDDGNLVIYKGAGPTDQRGWIWDRITTAPSSGFNFSSAVESVVGVVSSTVSNAAVGAGNAVAQVTVTAANDLAREVVAGANLVTTTIVNTANKVANDTVGVAVTVGRGVEQGGKIVGTEIVKNGEIVGYAVANLAVDAWNLLKGSCGVIGRKVFPIDVYFQGAKQITGGITAVGATYGAIDKNSAAAMKSVTDAANLCFEQVQDGFYCSFPKEIEKIVSQAGTIPGNLLNLATRVFNEAKTQECLIAGAATVTFGAMGLQVCALGKVVVTDAQKAFACFSAAESKGVMKKFFTPAAASSATSFPNKASCEGIGELAFMVAETIVTDGLSKEAKAAKAQGKSNTLAIVADELRTVYKIAAAGATYQQVVDELDKLPECK